jgi:hypothetical protein
VPSCAYCQASLQGIEVVGYEERQGNTAKVTLCL